MYVAVLLAALTGAVEGDAALTLGAAVDTRIDTESTLLKALTHAGVRVEASSDTGFFIAARGSFLFSASVAAPRSGYTALYLQPEDLGSTLSLGLRTRSGVFRGLVLEVAPINAVHRQVFFDWANRVGHAPSNQWLAPGLTLELRFEHFSLWGMARLRPMVEEPRGYEPRAQPPKVDGFVGVDVKLPARLTLGVRGAYLEGSDGAFAHGLSSAQLVWTLNEAVEPLVDLVTYGSDPLRFSRFFAKPRESIHDFAVQLSAEGGATWSSVGYPYTIVTPGWRFGGWGDVQARLRYGDARFSLAARLHTLTQKALFNFPGFSQGGVQQPHFEVLLGAAYTVTAARLTPGLVLGLSRPASDRGLYVEDDGRVRAVLGTEEVRLAFNAKATLRWDATRWLSLLGELDFNTGQPALGDAPVQGLYGLSNTGSPALRGQLYVQLHVR